jgi:cytoskeletal protein CcmA (bactofilin family)
MFNKQGPSTRDDVIVRKDIRGFLTPGAIPATQQVADLTTRAALEAESASGEQVMPASAPAPDEAVPGNENPASEARLIVTMSSSRGRDSRLRHPVVEGRVEATMDSRVIRIAEQGAFTGKVSIDIAEIHGRFEGELTARSQLIIHATGRVSGKIRYGKLVVDEGGELCGDVNTLSAEKSLQQRPRNETLPALSAVGM